MLQLLLVRGQLLLRLLQLQRELGRGLAIAGLEVGLGLGFELLDVRPVRRHLPGDPLDQPAVLLEADAAFLELLDRAVVLVLHLRDRVGLPEDVGDLVDLRHERGPELLKNHMNRPLPDRYVATFCGFPFAGVGRLGKDLALIDAVERRAQLGAVAGADDVAADVLQKRELRGVGVERDEVDLHGAVALAEDVARDVVRDCGRWCCRRR